MPLSHGHQLKVEQEEHDEHDQHDEIDEIDEHVEYVGERVKEQEGFMGISMAGVRNNSVSLQESLML